MEKIRTGILELAETFNFSKEEEEKATRKTKLYADAHMVKAGTEKERGMGKPRIAEIKNKLKGGKPHQNAKYRWKVDTQLTEYSADYSLLIFL